MKGRFFITRTRRTGKKLLGRQASFLWMGLALFSLTLSAFVTSTVAWFAVSDYLRVENIEISFEGQDIQIGQQTESGAINWGSEVSSDEQIYLTPVSSMFQDNRASNYATKAFPTYANQYPQSSGNCGDTGIATKGFHQMEVFLRCEVGTYVYLDKTTSIKANETMNRIIADQTGKSLEELNNIEKAMRVNFYSQDASIIYEPNVTESSHTKLGGLLDVQLWDGYYDYNSSSMEELLYGEYNNNNAVLYYDEPSETDTLHPETDSLKDGFKGKTRAGVKHLDLEKSKTQGGLEIKEEETYTLDDLAVGGQEIMYLYPGVTTRLVVTFYLEGWDLDCSSELIDAAFSAELNFIGLQKPKH